MRRAIVILFLFLLGLYGLLHLVLGSSPVQKRVVAELQLVLAEFGVSLEMESIEFSALSPKVYLNRVKLESKPGAKLHLESPLSIDKIKVQFRPLALLFGRIVIDELMLYHPRIQIPHADKFYAAAMGLVGAQGALKVERKSFDVVFYKMGVVDALFNIEAKVPDLAVRSRSLTVIVEKGSGQQRSVRVQSDNLETVWDKMPLVLSRVDVDLDLAADSLRLNKGFLENEDFSVNLIGISRMPGASETLPQTFNASYDIKGDLAFLRKYPLIGSPVLEGKVSTSGTIRKNADLYSGKGQVAYEKVAYRGYEIGTGNLSFILDKRRMEIHQAAMQYANGDFKAAKLQVDLTDHFPVSGDLAVNGLLLQSVLSAVGVDDPEVAMGVGGKIKVSGTLMEPFELKAALDTKISELVVLDDPTKPPSKTNNLVEFGSGTLRGLLTFTRDKMDFDAEAALLGGTVKSKGYVGFDDTSKLTVSGENLSLTQLERIANLDVGGKAKLNAEVDVRGEDSHIAGDFEVQDTKVADLRLGFVKGEAFYQGLLLTFENLLMPSLEPVRGNGFVDFKSPETAYKFYVNARRTETDQVFAILKGLDFTFEIPTGGEVNTRVTVEGGGDRAGKVRVTASGQGKNFNWFNERWMSGTFNLTYADSVLELPKVLLTKPSGALEVRGRFTQNDGRLQLSTYGLEIANFEHFGNAPLSGQVSGQVAFEGPKGKLFGQGRGELKLVKTRFRGVSIPDSVVKIRPEGDKLEYLFNLGNDRMRGRYVRHPNPKKDELLVYFSDYDFAPLAALALSRDIPPLADLRASGEMSAVGDFYNLESLKGSGTVNKLLVGFKGTPMEIQKPVQIKMDEKGIRVDAFSLQGEDSLINLSINYETDRRLEAQLDGRIDLQYLQPFIPGLDYGNGKVTAGLRISGPPAKYQLLGNLALQGGTFRLSGFLDEFRGVEARLSLSQDKINIDRFDSNVNGGTVTLDGDIRLDRFHQLSPNIRIHADKVSMHVQDYLAGRLSAELFIRGKSRPYMLGGSCEIHEASLTKLQADTSSSPIGKRVPLFTYDVQCQGADHLFVATDIMQAEFRGAFHLVGDSQDVGLLGNAEALRGSVLFRETRFNLDTGSVKFESGSSILPRFRVSGHATVREVKNSTLVQPTQGGAPVRDVQNYEVNLQVSGIPSDYKIRLTSTPALLEGQIISLLVLGVATGGQQDGNYMDLGSALVGQFPLQKKLKNDLGVNIKLSNQPQSSMQQGSNLSPGTANYDINAPTVQIQKQITDTTKLSYSNSLDSVPVREFRIEQMLDENLSVNAATMDRSKGSTNQSTQAYGLDFRYRFQFE